MSENFDKMLKFVLLREGGYSNNPNDKGGETNKGITYQTYNSYRKSRGLSPRSVKYITDEEVRDIYYNNYYKASGADKIQNPKLAAYVFDTAVNMGVSRAKEFLAKSGNDLNTYEQLRRNKYNQFVEYDSSQRCFLQGWNNRINSLREFVDNEFPEEETFNDNVVPSLLLQGYVDTIYFPRSNVLYSRNDIENMTQEEFENNEEAIMQQLSNGLIVQDAEASKYSNYTNPISGDNKIFSREDIENMSFEEYAKDEKLIQAQLNSIGIPSNSDLQKLINGGNVIYVNEYVRSDGTFVKGYYRSK
ncbi:MAG TPA: hypothetical protein DCS44_00350 [Cyanobacteria bacterium UBA10660]|jgi:hypothetical protein|nr:MAG TPA: hypothetical protein CPT83_07530 [Candidatus Gastranaerophilales bacterium HUM_1]HAS93050.1 hypothetical protein [Cyanobacteria bacterium UBA10660]